MLNRNPAELDGSRMSALYNAKGSALRRFIALIYSYDIPPGLFRKANPEASFYER